MITYSIGAGDHNGGIVVLKLQITKEMSDWFNGLPGHCEPACCGFGCLYLPDDRTKLKVGLPDILKFKFWIENVIALIDQNPQIKYCNAYCSESVFDIAGGEPKETKRFLTEVLQYLNELVV